MSLIDFRSMGCNARAVVDAGDAGAWLALERLRAWFAEAERVLSRFDPRSDLVRLNARGTLEHVDEVLWEAIDAAVGVAAESEGLVTPTILSALEAAGYDCSFDALSRDQGAPCSAATPSPDWRGIQLDRPTRTIRLQPGVRLDLGGTAKGWSVDRAASQLARVGPALVDVGGDIAVSGSPPEPWPIAVADPRGGDPLDLVLLRRGGIATSGRDFRRWRRGGIEQHHVIDPRTGAPARTNVWTATVIAAGALDAEVAAKRVLLTGCDEGMAWIDARPDLAALVLRDDEQVVRSKRFTEFQWRHAA